MHQALMDTSVSPFIRGIYDKYLNLMHCPIQSMKLEQGSYRKVRVKFKDFSRTSQTSPTVFKDLKLMKNTDISVQFLLQKC